MISVIVASVHVDSLNVYKIVIIDNTMHIEKNMGGYTNYELR